MVLDVAGGKGELSLHLTLAGARVTLVDPRKNSGYLSKWQRKLLRRSGRPPFDVTRSLFTDDAADDGSAALAAAAALVVGMHPDEATEAIVDAAVARRLPFAVVPCCVFSRLFSERRLRSGALVHTHAHLVSYLREKHPNVRTTQLPFAGKSTVVYCRGYELEEGGAPACERCEDE